MCSSPPPTLNVMTAWTPLIVYSDVDEALVRNADWAYISVSAATSHAQTLYGQGDDLSYWSFNGMTSAGQLTQAVGPEGLFLSFLSKPLNAAEGQTVETFRARLRTLT